MKPLPSGQSFASPASGIKSELKLKKKNVFPELKIELMVVLTVLQQ